MSRKYLIHILFFLLALPLSPFAQQAEKPEPPDWYTVEMVIFSQSSPTQEQWLPVDAPAATANALPIPAAGSTEGPLQGVPFDQYQLTPEAYSIDRSPGRKVLLHRAWRLPLTENGPAPWIKVADSSGVLDGFVRVSRRRFLHLNTHLLLRDPASGTANLFSKLVNLTGDAAQDAPPVPSFIAHRRMRSAELHYIDHPLAGILIRVDRHEPPQPALAAEPTATSPTPEPQTSQGNTPASGGTVPAN